MKQTMSLSEFSCLSEYTRLYPISIRFSGYANFFLRDVICFRVTGFIDMCCIYWPDSLATPVRVSAGAGVEDKMTSTDMP